LSNPDLFYLSLGNLQRHTSTVLDLSQPANLPQHFASLDGIRPDASLGYDRFLAQCRQRRKRGKENGCNSHVSRLRHLWAERELPVETIETHRDSATAVALPAEQCPPADMTTRTDCTQFRSSVYPLRHEGARSVDPTRNQLAG
jgi:hypothetical protein